MIKKNNLNLLIMNILNFNSCYLILIILSILLSIYMIILPLDNRYLAIKLVPIAYTIFILIFVNKNTIIGIGSASLIVLYFFRMCLVPLISAYGNFYHDTDISLYIHNFNLACILMIIECFTVFTSAKYFQKKYRKKLINIQNNIKKNELLTFNRNPFLYIILFFLMGTSIILFFIYPQLRGYFRFFFISNELSFELLKKFEKGISSLGPIYYIAKTLFEFTRPLFFFFILHKILNNKKLKGKKLYSLILTGIAFSFVSGEQIHSIFVAIICIYNILINTKSKSRVLKICLPACVIVFVGYGLYTFSSAGTPKMISRAIQNYFGGPVVMAAGLGVKADNPIVYFFNDIYNGSSLLVGIFGSRMSTTDLINGYVNSAAYGTFFSFIIQSKFFFEYFAPCAVVFIVGFIYKMDFDTEKFDNDFYRMIYQYISFSVSVFLIMYTFTMVVNYIIYSILGYVIIIFLDKKVRYKYNESVGDNSRLQC